MEDSFDQEEVKQGAPEWMTTFGDLMTLLLCFFVLLLSFSETDRAKYKEVAGSLEKAFGIQRDTPAWESPKGQSLIARNFDKEYQIVTKDREMVGKQLTEELAELFRSQASSGSEGGELEVKVEDDKIIISLMGESTFDSGKAEVRSEIKPLLDRIGQILKKAEGEIVISGHTDNVPLRGGPFRNNLRLSMARAAVVSEFFVEKQYLSQDRIITMGFGEFRPKDTNDTPRGREVNRRVEIIILKETIAAKKS